MKKKDVKNRFKSRKVSNYSVINKKNIIITIILIILLLSLFTLQLIINSYYIPEDLTGELGSFKSFSQGSGTEQDPYLITNCFELQNISDELSSYYLLMNDIDCSDTINWNSGSGFMPIGNTSKPFNGTFNGNNYNITNLYINRQTEDFVGLFGYALNSDIGNVGLVNVNIIGDYDVGGLVGYVNRGNISNSYSTGSVSGTGDLGGLVGFSSEENILNSYSEANAASNGGNVGGLLGYSNFSTIINSSSTGDVFVIGGFGGGLVGVLSSSVLTNSFSTGETSSASEAGGLIGGLIGNSSSSNISNCYATGNVAETRSFGGGLISISSSSNISNCYATGDVAAWTAGGLIGTLNSGYVYNSFAVGSISNFDVEYGGLVGINNGNIINSYWNNVSENPSSCYSVGDSGCTAIQDNISYFKDNVFPSREPFAQWSFFSIWQERTNDYPSLIWQGLGGDINLSGQIQISTCNDLQNIKNNVSGGFVVGNYILTNNIDCSATTTWNGGLGFMPVGNTSKPFNGTFNGNNHTISNLYINRPTEDYVGLFGYSNGSYISNIGLVNVNVNGKDFTGGLVGYIKYGIVSNSYSTGKINGSGTLGGLVGYIGTGNISNSYSISNVTGSNFHVGGLVGYIEETSISNSYVAGRVTGLAVGGLVGYNNNGNISNSYSTGNFTGSFSGGLVSNYEGGNILNSYWNNNSGYPDNCYYYPFGGDDGCAVIQNNEAYFKGDVYPSRQPFTQWSFFSIWQERTNDFPSLTWQGLGGDINNQTNPTEGTNENTGGSPSGGSVSVGGFNLPNQNQTNDNLTPNDSNTNDNSLGSGNEEIPIVYKKKEFNLALYLIIFISILIILIILSLIIIFRLRVKKLDIKA